jgi:hypothetical protein
MLAEDKIHHLLIFPWHILHRKVDGKGSYGFGSIPINTFLVG